MVFIFAVMTAPLSGRSHESVLDPLNHANHFASLLKVRGANELGKHVPLMIGRSGFVRADTSVVQVRQGEAIAHESNRDLLRARNVAHSWRVAFFSATIHASLSSITLMGIGLPRIC